LIGLPPTPEQVEDFLGNPSPKAYEKVVDRLLASPQFGERWARHWLDLARYSETLGHEFDYPLHNAWRYRDYVIRALNADLPYDQFVLEHIAGDLLPNPRRHPTEHFNESVIGTVFFWLGQREHSPVDVRQHQAEVIDNQIDVMSKMFLGLTVSCARCHDHKFDAIPTKDFYALYGVLESSRYTQKAIDSAAQLKVEKLNKLKKEIRLAAVSEWSKQAGKLAKYILEVSRLPSKEPLTPTFSPSDGEKEKVNQRLESTFHPNGFQAGRDEHHLEAELSVRWSNALGAKVPVDQHNPFYPWLKLSSIGTDSAQRLPQQWNLLLKETSSVEQSSGETNYEVYAQALGGRFDGWFVEGDAFNGRSGGEGDFIVTQNKLAILHQPVVDDRVISRRLEGALRSPGFELKQGYIHIKAAGRDSRIRICVDNFTMIREPIYGGLMKPLDRDEPAWSSFDVRMWIGHRAYIEMIDSSTPDPTYELKKDAPVHEGWISASRVLFSGSSTPPPETEAATWRQLLGTQAPNSLEELAVRYQTAFRQALRTWKSNKGHFSSAEQAQLAFLDWLLQKGLLGTFRSSSGGEGRGEESSGNHRRSMVSSLLAEYRRIETSLREPVCVPAMAEGDGFDEHIFIRGNHKIPGELAPRQFLTALRTQNETPFQGGSGRLELARCMTNPSNPLLARVMVNRVWEHLFGRGIVATPDDFGKLGQSPTHPELLDWLANWYRTEAHWSTKRLIRMLVTSSTYRMSSELTNSAAEEQDPDNLLFHRMPIRRLEGEALRDAMLAISGRLNNKMFGAPVPTHLTDFMEGRGRPGTSGPLDGAGRRSIYLEVRRNFISPMLRTFDTPVPFTTIGKRTVSNVPAQSLILLNDPFVLGQAQLWARRILGDPDPSPEERITGIYLRAFGRVPTADEQGKAQAFLKQQVVGYGGSAAEWLHDERGWADLCHVMFNVK